MPKKIHAHRSHHRHSDGQEGFIANAVRRTMNKNEKIIMGVLVGGIVVFLILSVVILFGKGSKKISDNNVPTTSTTPAVKVLTTPYPTIPPVTDFYMQVNETRFYPETVSIDRNHTVTVLNIGKKTTTISPTTQGNAYDFGEVEVGEEKSISFDKPGVYRYTRTGKPDQTLTITVK